MSQLFGPLLEVARIQSEINRLFDNLLDLGPREGTGTAWIPHADILETPDSVIVKIELPGVDAGHLALSVHSGNVIVEGEKPRTEVREPAEFQVAERATHSRPNLHRALRSATSCPGTPGRFRSRLRSLRGDEARSAAASFPAPSARRQDPRARWQRRHARSSRRPGVRASRRG